MAWPPLIPPNTRLNDTVTADNHPSDHNQLADALTNVVDYVQSFAISSAVNVSSVGTPEVALPAVDASFDVIIGQPYLVTVWCPWRFGVGATSSVSTALKADGAIIAECSDYNDWISNQRWQQRMSLVWTPAVSPVAFSMTGESTISDMQTNAASTRQYGYSLEPVLAH